MNDKEKRPGITIDDRVRNGLLCVSAVSDRDDEPPEELVTDALADIMHYCSARGVNFDNCLYSATSHYIVESARGSKIMSAMMIKGNCYQGRRVNGEAIATVNGGVLKPRLDLVNHSPTGFEWGYGGSGPAQLALAILANELTDQQAIDHHQQYKWDVIGRMTDPSWTISGQSVHDWLLQQVYDHEPQSASHGH